MNPQLLKQDPLQEQYNKWARIAHDNEGKPEGKRACEEMDKIVRKQMLEQLKNEKKAEQK